ncbi:hypothetical protein [Providencia rettgeri]|uniref:hypothetical protein n=1 Tax=Providencia rettgeri TaxID=587 RepID=UPI0023AAD8B7|nr:hypothetical protein [Providencia rettgeri]
MAAFERIMHIGECIYCHEFEVIVFSDVAGDKQHYYGKFNDDDMVNCSRCLADGVIKSNGDEQFIEWNTYPDDSIKSWPRLKTVKDNG